jgi:hypothetical protein
VRINVVTASFILPKIKRTEKLLATRFELAPFRSSPPNSEIKIATEDNRTQLDNEQRTSEAKQSKEIWAGPTKTRGGGRWLLYTDQVGVKQFPA